MNYTGSCLKNHTKFECELEGYAEVQGMQTQIDPLHPMYKYPSAYTRPTEELIQYAKKMPKKKKAIWNVH